MNDSPRDFGVPHDYWRNGQLETVRWISRNNSDTMIVEAPVGSGKSAVGIALGRYGVVRILTYTLNLQDQYHDSYDADTVKGMANYLCEINPIFNADSCLFPDNMSNCPASASCGYLIDRDRAIASDRSALSYAYFLSGQKVHDAPAEYLYLDEAHLLPDIVRAHSSIQYTIEQLRAWDIPMYPRAQITNNKMRLRKAIDWLGNVIDYLNTELLRLGDIPSGLLRTSRGAALARKKAALNNKISELTRVQANALKYPHEFYVDWNDYQIRIVPLTARWFFNDLFRRDNKKIIATSATIGNPQVLAEELGLNKFAFHSVSSNFSPETMPIQAYSDAPRMNSRSGESAKNKQADIVAREINGLDPTWAGLIHVSSYKQANDLADRLSRRGLQDRVFIPDVKGTANKIAQWDDRKMRVPNTIALSPVFHQGLDAPDININIVAKIPFKALDKLGRARMDRNRRFYNLTAAIGLEQALGRTRRGSPEHYEVAGEPMRKYVGVVDNNYQLIYGELSDHVKQCINVN